MQFINYFLVAIVTYLGLIAGLVLSFIAPEEIKPGKKYFFWTKRIIYVLLSLSFLYFIKEIWIMAIALIILILFYFIIEKNYIQLLFAFLFFYSSNNIYSFVMIPLLIFLFNAFSVDKFAKIKKNRISNKKEFIKKVLINNLYFFICLPLFTILLLTV